MTKMPPAGYPAFLQYLQSGRVSDAQIMWLAEEDLEPDEELLCRLSNPQTSSHPRYP